MAAATVSSTRDRQHDVRWKWPLLGMCVLGVVWVALYWYGWAGFGGQPLTGFWNGGPGPSDKPFAVEFDQPEPGGAQDRAGIRAGDRADLREQSWAGRVLLVSDPLTTQPTELILHRGKRVFVTRVVGHPGYEGAQAWNLVPALLLSLWAFACAGIIAIRRSSLLEGRVLALIFICLGFTYAVFQPPDPTLRALALAFAPEGAVCVAFFLLVYLASHFGDRPTWRRLVEIVAYGAIAVKFLLNALFWVGFVTLKFDPFHNNFLDVTSPFAFVPTIAVATAAIVAVATAPPQVRPRAGWLLLPLPLMFVAFFSISYLGSYVAGGWFADLVIGILQNAIWVTGALLVTYALLKRRVLDLGFVLSRALVVSIVGLMVVIAFVLLEWILGSVVAGVSHATGLIANAMLALIIGVSMNYVHKRVDHSVDLVLFRKRHEDEHALRAFSKEAAYVTDWSALIDATLEKVRRHTDARSAALLIGASGSFSAVRSFGESTATSVSENDEAILALKTWHRPIDPHHHYDTALHAALVLPMLARGRLYGVLVLGERVGGEAYAPDEVEALSQLAIGVGSALEVLSLATDGSAEVLVERVERAIASMGEEMVSRICAEIRALRTSSLT